MAKTKNVQRFGPRADHTEALNNLAVGLLEEKRYEDALKACEAGLQLAPDSYELLGNYAAACSRLDLHKESLDVSLKQLAVEKSDSRAWINAGNTLRSMGHLPESEHCLRQALALGGYDGAATYNLSMTLLLGGNLTDGFAAYERRFESKVMKDFVRQFDEPRWAGDDLTGKRILLWSEQGNGDMIQFARYVRSIQMRGAAEVIVETPRILERLFRAMMSGVTFADRNSLPEFDVHCPLLSLTHMCGEIPSLVPAVIPQATAAVWRERISVFMQRHVQARKVALIWAGNPAHANDRNRSIALKTLLPLLDCGGNCWFSLQVGPGTADLQREPYPIYDLAPFCTDYIETAAALEQMDLVISVDTSVAHLAGTQGCPVWTLIPFAPDWRWMLKHQETPWYPTMRLFRQPEPQDWETVVKAVAEGLQKM